MEDVEVDKGIEEEAEDILDDIGKQFLFGLSPFPNRGRVFIGFSSHQTTGAGYCIRSFFLSFLYPSFRMNYIK